MRIANLITVYKNPGQVERFIKRMAHPNFDFYIHLDGKVDIKDFIFLKKLPQVYFIKNRIKVSWGGYSFTKAIINSIEEILESNIDYSFINLLSGQDYPIKPIQLIYDYLDTRKNLSFVMYSLPDYEDWWTHALTRITSYHFTDYSFKGRYFLQFLINKLMPPRKFPLPVELYGSSCATWWTLNKEVAQYVVNFLRENKQLDRFMRLTWCADEFLIPTILMNSPYKPYIVNNNLRHIDWSEGGSNPKILRITDADILTHSDRLVARKFDVTIDKEILDYIDQIIS